MVESSSGVQGPVALVYCPVGSLEMPPIGIASLSSSLRSKGLEPIPMDLNVRSYLDCSDHLREYWDNRRLIDLTDSQRFARTSLNLEPIINYCVELLLDLPTMAIGFSTFRTNLLISCEIASRIRRLDSDRLLIFGGPSADVPGERDVILKHGADAIIVGESELALPMLLNSEGAASWCSHPGVIVPVHHQRNREVSRQIVSDLNSIPFPDYGSFDIDLYKRRDQHGHPVFPIVGSRGCILKCGYCNDHVLAKPYRTRSAEHIFSELCWHHDQLDARTFSFGDLLINGNLRVLSKLADLILERGLEISWTGQAIPRRDMGTDLLQKLARSGLERLTLGIESGSERVRKLMNKTAALMDPELALRRCHDAGIQTAINLIIGFPGEAAEDFEDSLAFLQQNREFIDLVENIHPLLVTPLSPLERNPSAFGIRPLSDRPLERSIRWTGVDGNNYDLRRRRVLALARELEILGISFDRENLNLLGG